MFVLDGEHNYRRFSSYPFPAKVFHEKNDSGCRGPIIVEDELITDLLKFDFSALDKKKLVRLKEYCFKELTKRDISALMSIMNDSNN